MSNRKLDLNQNSPFATKSMTEEEQKDNFCIQLVAFVTHENAVFEKHNMQPLCSLAVNKMMISTFEQAFP
ncbi:hypothetical protein PIB30_074476 [Stylosanthes scabra]|uniref:Uncharacterized protein n=1 Tax=Stylosanthes scabra TaxID=79078 RepID=A0ABU6YQ89_9FABA|nr:hypothetical protein [Stylosanthes scabra]